MSFFTHLWYNYSISAYSLMDRIWPSEGYGAGSIPTEHANDKV